MKATIKIFALAFFLFNFSFFAEGQLLSPEQVRRLINDELVKLNSELIKELQRRLEECMSDMGGGGGSITPCPPCDHSACRVRERNCEDRLNKMIAERDDWRKKFNEIMMALQECRNQQQVCADEVRRLTEELNKCRQQKALTEKALIDTTRALQRERRRRIIAELERDSLKDRNRDMRKVAIGKSIQFTVFENRSIVKTAYKIADKQRNGETISSKEWQAFGDLQKRKSSNGKARSLFKEENPFFFTSLCALFKGDKIKVKNDKVWKFRIKCETNDVKHNEEVFITLFKGLNVYMRVSKRFFFSQGNLDAEFEIFPRYSEDDEVNNVLELAKSVNYSLKISDKPLGDNGLNNNYIFYTIEFEVK